MTPVPNRFGTVFQVVGRLHPESSYVVNSMDIFVLGERSPSSCEKCQNGVKMISSEVIRQSLTTGRYMYIDPTDNI